MPVLSLGGMRFQQSWKDLDPKEIDSQQQDILRKTIKHASQKGMHHIETARHYGTSERQMAGPLVKSMTQKEYYKRKSHQIMIL